MGPQTLLLSDLPTELVVDILARLPVESIIRFKCVSKSWYNLLKSPDFIACNRAYHTREYMFYSHVNHHGIPNASIISHKIDGDVGDSDVIFSHFQLPPCFQKPGCTIVGHCDGLIALVHFKNASITICNPATRDYRTLPDDNPNPLDTRKYTNRQNAMCLPCHGFGIANAFGFGYDRKTKGYKILRIIPSGSYTAKDCPFIAQVFSLNTDSTWREIPLKYSARRSLINHTERYLDGIWYWLASNDTEEDVVVSFDMADEVFLHAPLPDDLRRGAIIRHENWIELGVYMNESIALFVTPIGKFEICITVWVMKEFGVKASWTKQHTIGPLLGLERPLAFWKTYSEFFFQGYGGRLVSCDIATLQFKTSPPSLSSGFSSAITFVKTLVPLNVRESFVT